MEALKLTLDVVLHYSITMYVIETGTQTYYVG